MHPLTRRRFIQTTAFTAASTLSPMGFCAQSKKKPSNPHEEGISDMVLLGKKQPDLHGKGFKLHKIAAESFLKMVEAAKKDGIEIFCDSSYRSYDHQKRIWNAKYIRLNKDKRDPLSIIEEIVQYSSIPGTSRHHWGTEVDIIDNAPAKPADPELTEYFLEGGIYHNLYLWLQKNASSFGFYEVYTNEPNRTGYAYEPWHWSFAELSVPFLKQYLTIDLVKEFKNSTLEGKEQFTPAFLERFKQQWVLGINPVLIPK